MLSTLKESLAAALRKVRGQARLSQKDVEHTIRQIRIALLEADVNLKVVRGLTQRLSRQLLGAEVGGGLTPAQEVIKLVYQEIVRLLGDPEEAPVRSSYGERSARIMLVGLQGSGKTTTAGKLALHYKTQGLRPLLVALDLSRPAAIEQLAVLAQEAGVEAFHQDSRSAVKLAQDASRHSEGKGYSPVIFDTAGRLHIDDELMAELAEIKAAIAPEEVLLVADAMTGQEAVNIAQTFEQRLGITGVILTKFDGDARGGAALSIRETVGRSIRLVGVGEKLDALEPFYPERWAQRILGMGDMLTLIEKAEAAFTVEEAREMERRVRKRKFTLSEFLDILQKAKKLGSLGQVARLIPGVQLNEEQLAAGQKELRRVEAIVRSMTPLERKDPRVLNASRRRRIAAGSGTTVQDINRFIKQFAQMQQAMEQLKRGKLPLGNLLKRGRF